MSVAGRLVDIVAGVTLLEGAGLLWWRRRTGRGPDPRATVAMLVPGLCLLLTLRLATVGAGWVWIAAGLAASGLAHAADLRGRWPARPPARRPASD